MKSKTKRTNRRDAEALRFTDDELLSLSLVFGYLENDLGERSHYEAHRHEGHIWLQIERARAAVERVSNSRGAKGKA